MPVLVSGPSCGTVLRHLVECTGAKPLRPELERQGSLAARGDGTAGPSGGRAGRAAFLATVPAVGVGSPCHVDAAWGRFGSFSWWHPSARTGRVQPAARERCDRNSKHPDCLQGHHHSTLRCGLCGRGHLPYPSAAPDIAKNTQSPQITFHCHILGFHGFSDPMHTSASHTQTAPSMSTVPTHPRDFPHMLAPFSHTFLRLPHTVTKLQKIRLQFQRDQRFRPRKPGADPVSTNSLRRLPARYRMSGRGANPLRPAAGLRGFPATKGDGSGNALHHLRGHVSTGLASRPFTRAVSVPARKNGASPTRRDQRPVHSNLRARPVYPNSLRLRAAWRRFATRRRHGDGVDIRGANACYGRA